MSNNNNLPLHKTTHWRRFKFSAKLLMKAEDVDIEQYDMDHIRCYSTVGSELNGNNITFSSECKCSPWVSDNEYDVYEIPKRTNHSKIQSEGSFFIMAHNTLFNYWVAGHFTSKINTQMTINKNHFYENCSFVPTGMYEIGGSDNGDVIVYKKKTTKNIDCGFSLPHTFSNAFDSLGARKKAYGLTETSILFKLKNANENQHFISDTQEVKKYKKRK